MPRISDTPYEERTDDERLESNWKKARKLFERDDYSASIIRAATASEIAANIYIRHFLISEHKLPPQYVDSLLISANGLDGKFNRLIKPAAQHRKTWEKLKSIQKLITTLHEHRNAIAHAGYFKNKDDAKESLSSSLAIIQALAPNESAKLILPFDK